MGDRSGHHPARPARGAQTVGERARGFERIFYVLWTGCQWKALPKDLPPKSTVHDYLELWNWDGTLERIHHALYVASARRRDVKRARRWRSSTCRPRRALKRGSWLDPSGYDAGKKIKGRKRHILVDTLGLLLNVVVHPADIQDRDGGLSLAVPGATTIPVHRTHFCRRRIRGTQDGDDGVAHWCLELANRQAIGRCWI